MCIGASNLDIIGVSKKELFKEDSNPGRIELVFGGVAKNIAENLHRLGENVELLTFIGKDSFGEEIQAYLNHLGIKFQNSFISPTLPSGKYMAVHSASGELVSAVNDFTLIESITQEFFFQIDSYIASFDLLCLDTNLSEDCLTYLIEKYKDKSIICDGVSQTKVRRIKTVMKHIDLLKVNSHELSALLDRKVDDVIMGVKSLVGNGMNQVVVTNGRDAITYNNQGKIYQTLIFEPASTKSSAGAGDALLAGIIYGLNHGKSMHEALNLGKKAASLTMEVDQACNPFLTKELLEE